MSNESIREPRVRVAVILYRDGQVLLVRHLKEGRTYWLLPGGGVDWGETIEEAALREVREETGLDILLDRLVFVGDSIPEKLHRHIINIYFTGTIVGGQLKAEENTIVQEVKFFSVEELPQLIIYPPLTDLIIKARDPHFVQGALYLGNTWV